jgi:hypothetical protein
MDASGLAAPLPHDSHSCRLHGDSDQTVPFEGSSRRTHDAIPGSNQYLIAGALVLIARRQLEQVEVRPRRAPDRRMQEQAG